LLFAVVRPGDYQRVSLSGTTVTQERNAIAIMRKAAWTFFRIDLKGRGARSQYRNFEDLSGIVGGAGCITVIDGISVG
jgi:hypothetical protein